VFHISEGSQVKKKTDKISYITRQINPKFIMMWWGQWELTHWNSLLIPCLENLSGTLCRSGPKGEGAGVPKPQEMKPPSSYWLLKFVHPTSQLCHSLVVHPLLRKILDPPLLCESSFSVSCNELVFKQTVSNKFVNF